jgi:hypothetical protein
MKMLWYKVVMGRQAHTTFVPKQDLTACSIAYSFLTHLYSGAAAAIGANRQSNRALYPPECQNPPPGMSAAPSSQLLAARVLSGGRWGEKVRYVHPLRSLPSQSVRHR